MIKITDTEQAPAHRSPAGHAAANEPAQRAGLLSRLASHRIAIGATALGLLVSLGVMAANGWLPHTDMLNGEKTGWFGTKLPKNAANTWNPFAAPPPSATPQLSKELIYAGGRLLNTIDSKASEIPPVDLAVWRPSDGTWHILGVEGSTQFGEEGDFPVQGDFDGDGKTDFAVYRPTEGNWYVLRSSDGNADITFFGGVCMTQVCDPAAVADFDGDGRTDLALFHRSTGTWHIKLSSTGAPIQQQFGLSTDTPAPGDYDGDGSADIGVWRSSNNTFYSKNSSNGALQSITVGGSGYVPVSGDYDGDGVDDFAAYDADNDMWEILDSSTSQMRQPLQLEQTGGVPVQNDYDGDGKIDIAVWHINEKGEGNWYILQSATDTMRFESWGSEGDIPVPLYYRR